MQLTKIMHSFLKIFAFFILATFFYLPSLKCQQIELQAEGGLIMPSVHPASNALLKQSNYMAISLQFGWHCDTTKIYSKIYNHPIYGIGIYYGTFNNQSIGNPLAVYFFIKTPFICKKSWKAFYEIGSGMADNFNPYDKYTNPNNELIGSKLNMFGHLSIGIEYRILKRLKLGATVGYRHFSNGFIKAPNFGINVMPVTLSGTYNLPEIKSHYLKENVHSFLQHNLISIFYAPGSKNFGAGERNYFVSTIGFQFIHQISYKTGIGGGFDIFYKSSGKDKVQGEESGISKSLSSGMCVSIEWVLTEKFRINTGAGLYLLRNPENDEPYPFYERISARYSITKNLFAGVGIKINGNSSDYIEWTLGYVFKKDKNIYN